MTFVDPPSIRKQANNARALEFHLHFVGKNHQTRATSGIVVKAVQMLKANADGQPDTLADGWDFYWLGVQTSATEPLTDPLEEE